MNIIFTCNSDSTDVCLTELNVICPDIKFVRWIEGGVGILSINDEFDEFSSKIEEKKPIFLRHIFPVQYVINIDEIQSTLYDMEKKLSINYSFSVQTRTLYSDDNKYLLNKIIMEYFVERNFKYSKNNPDYVISLYLENNTIYIGLSRTEDNLSSWTGGMHRYAKYEGQISRAEFKLLEAIDDLNIKFPENGKALDLGAAPGGWSKVLINKGILVTAVDPAKINESLIKHHLFNHFKGTVQQYLIEKHHNYNIIVNDMKMDVNKSCNIMLQLYENLCNDGIVIMTFKLLSKNKIKQINSGINLLKQKYSIMHIKQLFNNRNEVTIVMKK